MDKVLVAPSTDPAKGLDDLFVYVKEISQYADLLHCDVMDTNFVSKKTFSYDVVSMLNKITTLPLDVHLMVNEPSKVLTKYIEGGANVVTVHFEAYSNKKKLISDLITIRNKGCLAGLSICPETSLLAIKDLLSFCDLVLIMSVVPGKSGQVFIESSLTKVSQLKALKDEYNLNLKIEVDGGINPEVSGKLISLGCDILVSGSYVYNAKDKKEAILTLKK